MSRAMKCLGNGAHGGHLRPRFEVLAVAVAIVVSMLAGPAAWAYPAAGRDEFDSSAIVTIDLTMSGGPMMPVTLGGPVEIRRGNPSDPGDGKIEIDTELISMQLVGPTMFGRVTVTKSPAPPSVGKIKQQAAGVDFPADSYFDVFVLINTPGGILHNNAPMRLQTVINSIPPLGESYTPPLVIGVALFNAANLQVGIITHARHHVGQTPSFSLAPGGTSGGPAEIFDVPTVIGIPAASLGLGPGDNVDALSYGVDSPFRSGGLRFSVDPAALGVAGTAVRIEATKAPAEAQGDEFAVIQGGNIQVLDENGDTALPFPLIPVTDDVDALTELPTSAVDPDGNGVPDLPVYLSLSAASPALGAAGATSADILMSVGGAAPVVFIPQAALGLGTFGPGDDVDAICLDDLTMTVAFSLRPGSPTLTKTGRSPADLFRVIGAGPPLAVPPPVWVPAAGLGLLATDNLNALKCGISVVDVHLTPRFHNPALTAWGVTMLVGLMLLAGAWILRRGLQQ